MLILVLVVAVVIFVAVLIEVAVMVPMLPPAAVTIAPAFVHREMPVRETEMRAVQQDR
ncbi:MAG: hypothetical protein WA465_03690 [Methylovirgula sp.]